MNDLFVLVILFFFNNIIQKLSAAEQITLAGETILLHDSNECKQRIQFREITHTKTVQMQLLNDFHYKKQIMFRLFKLLLHHVVE